MFADCSEADIMGALRVGVFAFLLHAVAYALWLRRLGVRSFWSAPLAILPAISVSSYVLRPLCVRSFGMEVEFLSIFGAPLLGAVIFVQIFRTHEFPTTWPFMYQGFNVARQLSNILSLPFGLLLSVPFLGAFSTLAWYLASMGLPNLLFLPPESDPQKKSLREQIIGWLFLLLPWAVLVLLVCALIS